MKEHGKKTKKKNMKITIRKRKKHANKTNKHDKVYGITYMIIHIIIATFQIPMNVLKNLIFNKNSLLLSTRKTVSTKILKLTN